MLDLVWIAPTEPGDSPAAALAVFTCAQDRIRAEEAVQISAAAAYATFHTDEHGELSEFCAVEFGAVTGMSTDAAQAFLREAVEVTSRLPQVWARVQAGEVAGWKARRIADATIPLSKQAAAWADREVAPRADRVGPVKLDQITAEALARFDPEAASAEAETALEKREARFFPDGPVTHLQATLDAADAADLDVALSAIASTLDTETPLDIRRAKALGMLARGETGAQISREVVLLVHLTEGATIAQVRSHTGRILGRPGAAGIVSIDQVADWCHDAARVVVKPVIDPGETLISHGYTPSDRVRDHVTAVCQTCAFPWCNRAAEHLDLDHITPYDRPEHGGPPGQTATANLAPLCRRHHRAKTFTGWSYSQHAPGEFLWTSIYGWHFLRTSEGTTNLGRRRTHAA